MAKYSGKTARSTATRTVPSAPIKTTKTASTRTSEGDLGWTRDAKSELFMLAVTFMGQGEDFFYESGDARHDRFVNLVHQVTAEDADWMFKFIPWLRTGANMRTAPIVAAIEYARAGGVDADMLICETCQRGDEPAEALGYYWATNGGRKTLKKNVEHGIHMAAEKLYTEFNALKYDGGSRGVRMGDVIEVAHPWTPHDWQNALFTYLLDRRHHATDVRADLSLLPKVTKWRELQEMPRDKRREYLRTFGAQALADAAMTWETLSEWLPGGMDAEAWEAVIPNMGYMALLRNLRNFEQAGISKTMVKTVVNRLSNPDEVAKSKQFPYRFLSAHKAVNNVQWTAAIEEALNYSVRNVPALTGKSLILVDVSGSMQQNVSDKSQIRMWEVGGLFGVAQYLRAGSHGTLVAFGTDSAKVPLAKGTSVLTGIERLSEVVRHGRVGHGTNTWQAVSKHFDGHDRVFIFTDMQSTGYGRGNAASLIAGIPVYNFNVGGYRQTNMVIGENRNYEMGGFTDATFRQIAAIEAGVDGTWPWE